MRTSAACFPGFLLGRRRISKSLDVTVQPNSTYLPQSNQNTAADLRNGIGTGESSSLHRHQRAPGQSKAAHRRIQAMNDAFVLRNEPSNLSLWNFHLDAGWSGFAERAKAAHALESAA